MPLRVAKLYKIFEFQCISLFLLWFIGSCCGTTWWFYYYCEYRKYCATTMSLVKVQASLINGCSNFTNLPCSLQMQIDVFFCKQIFDTLLSVDSYCCNLRMASHSSLLALCHCLLYSSRCYLSYSSGTLFSKPYFSHYLYIHGTSFRIRSHTEYVICEDFDDLWYTLCENAVHPLMLDECFPDGNSRPARFYRLMKKIKQHTGIEEDKLLVTVVFGIVVNGFIVMSMFITCYLWETHRQFEYVGGQPKTTSSTCFKWFICI